MPLLPRSGFLRSLGSPEFFETQSVGARRSERESRARAFDFRCAVIGREREGRGRREGKCEGDLTKHTGRRLTTVRGLRHSSNQFYRQFPPDRSESSRYLLRIFLGRRYLIEDAAIALMHYRFVKRHFFGARVATLEINPCLSAGPRYQGRSGLWTRFRKPRDWFSGGFFSLGS